MTKPQDIIAIDTETGGLYPAINPLLSVAIVPSWTMEPFTVYIEPLALETIHPSAAEKNGYTQKKWRERGAVPLAIAMQQVNAHLGRLKKEKPAALMVAHNAGFDRSFMEEAYRQCDLEPLHRYDWRCSQQLMAVMMDIGHIAQGSLSLDRLGELSGQWPVGGRPPIHEAHEDALACLLGYQFLQRIAL